jgi:serine/threonine protein kinase
VCALQTLYIVQSPEAYGVRLGTPEFAACTEELLREARLLHSLRHPNIVQLRGVTLHPMLRHVQWIVTERAVGSLESWLASRDRLSLAELLDLLRSVMRALAYLHSRTPAVLHRDVKPANVHVFTTARGAIVWKLGDVGTAEVLSPGSRFAEGVCGTPYFTAPEVLLGPYDGKADVFSTGIMAAELVVRHVDIVGCEVVAATTFSTVEDRSAMVSDACRRLDTVCPPLSSVLWRCCSESAADRMGSDEVLRALEDIDLGDDGKASLPTTTTSISISVSMPMKTVTTTSTTTTTTTTTTPTTTTAAAATTLEDKAVGGAGRRVTPSAPTSTGPRGGGEPECALWCLTSLPRTRTPLLPVASACIVFAALALLFVCSVSSSRCHVASACDPRRPRALARVRGTVRCRFGARWSVAISLMLRAACRRGVCVCV